MYFIAQNTSDWSRRRGDLHFLSKQRPGIAEELARAVGTSVSAVSRVGSGQHPTSVQTLERFARALEVELDVSFREPVARMFRAPEVPEQKRAEHDLESALAPFDAPDGVELPTTATAVGRKPYAIFAPTD